MTLQTYSFIRIHPHNPHLIRLESQTAATKHLSIASIRVNSRPFAVKKYSSRSQPFSLFPPTPQRESGTQDAMDWYSGGASKAGVNPGSGGMEPKPAGEIPEQSHRHPLCGGARTAAVAFQQHGVDAGTGRSFNVYPYLAIVDPKSEEVLAFTHQKEYSADDRKALKSVKDAVRDYKP